MGNNNGYCQRRNAFMCYQEDAERKRPRIDSCKYNVRDVKKNVLSTLSVVSSDATRGGRGRLLEIVGSNFFWTRTRTRLIKLNRTRTRTRTFFSFKNLFILSKIFSNLKLSVGLKMQDAFIRLLI
jgi:hypothetical protein